MQDRAYERKGAGPAVCSSRISITFSYLRAWRMSLVEIREKAFALIAAMAIRIAVSAADASIPVMNLASALRRRLIALKRTFPLARSTLARHFPGSRSKALTTNCLYSTTDPPIPRFSFSWGLRRAMGGSLLQC
jgi:hypothetical protein